MKTCNAVRFQITDGVGGLNLSVSILFCFFGKALAIVGRVWLNITTRKVRNGLLTLSYILLYPRFITIIIVGYTQALNYAGGLKKFLWAMNLL